MGKLNATILAKIKLAVASQQTPIPASNVELPQAMRYIEALLSDTTDLETLEKSLIRFFRIRPKQYNNTSSSISSIYSMLKTANILPEAPQTAEEKLLSEFLATLFTKPIAKKKNGVYTALSPIEPDTDDTVSIYNTVTNIEASNNELSQYGSKFNWDKASMIHGNTRLHDAVGIKDVALVTLLLAAGANMFALNRSKVSPFDNALSSDNDDIILQFITCPRITLSENSKNILSMVFIDAIKKGKYNLVAAMLSTDKIDRKTFLNTADADGHTPLHWASTMGNITIVKLLIDNGANANTTSNSKNTPLSSVSGRTNDNRKPDHPAIASMLLGAMTPAFINAETQDGRTALGWAFHNGNKDIVALLVQFEGINLSSTFKNGGNALLSAVEKNWDDTFKIILSTAEGIKLIDTADVNGWTPLHHAAKRGNKAIVQLLIDNGANANVENLNSNTPLSLLAGRHENNLTPDHTAIASILIGAMDPESVNAKTQSGRTALGWAVRMLNPDIVLVLVQFEQIELDELFDGKTIDKVATEHNWTHVTDALNVKRVRNWLVRNDMDTLDNQVRDLSLTVLEQKEEIEKLNTRIKELEARLPADSASTAVGTPYRLTVDTSGKIKLGSTLSFINIM